MMQTTMSFGQYTLVIEKLSRHYSQGYDIAFVNLIFLVAALTRGWRVS